MLQFFEYIKYIKYTLHLSVKDSKIMKSMYLYDHIVEVPGFFSSLEPSSVPYYGSNSERNTQLSSSRTSQNPPSSQTSVVQTMQEECKFILTREEQKPPEAERLKSVYAFQQFLKDYGYQISYVDGWFGKKTEQELIKFQTQNNLTATGIVNSTTAEKMDQLRRDKEVELDPDMLGKEVDMSVPLPIAMSAEGISTIAPVSQKPSVPSIAAKIVQDFLLKNYPDLYSNSVDGWYGNKSGEAIRKFKNRHNLSNDTIVDRATVELIEKQRATGTQSFSSSVQNGENPYQYEFTANSSFLSGGLSVNDSLSHCMKIEMISKLVAVEKEAPRPMSARIAQTILKDLKLYTDVVDGWYGNGTARSTSSFQARYGLQVTGEVDSATAQKMDLIRAHNQNLTFHEIQHVDGPRLSNSSFGNSDRPEVQAIYDEIKALDARFSSNNTKAMYDQFYNFSEIVDVEVENNVWEKVVGGDYLKNYIQEQNGTAYATNELVGLPALLEFVNEENGHLNSMTVSELELFKIAISQLGSLYGKKTDSNQASNGLDWTPENAEIYGNGFMIQNDQQVGKWDCSAYTSFVTGESYDSSMIAGNAERGITAQGTKIESSWSDDELRQRLTTGTVLARTGHVILVLGLYNNGDLLYSEAAGSGHFLSTKRISIQDIRQGNKAFTHYLNDT